METKHLMALMALITLTPALIVLTTISQRLRDWVFFFIVAPAVTLVDFNFLGACVSRGAARGLEVSLTDLMAIAILISSLLTPRYPGPRWIWPVSLGFMGLYFVYCCFSVSVSEQQM